jgi:flagellar assembly protein FliH
MDKKIIQTKKIENKKLAFEETRNPETHRQSLLEEIAELEQVVKKLQEDIELEQQTARVNLDSWLQERRQEAEEEALRQSREAMEQGFQAGFEQGARQAEEEHFEKRVEIASLLELAYEEKEKIIMDSEPFLLALSVRVAERIVKDELKQHEDQLLNVVRQALRHIEESEDVVLQVAAEDYPVILPFLEELKTYVRADSELKLVPVASVSQGGCMIHTASGSYDVTLDSQLEEIKKQLLAYCEEKTNDEPSSR